VTKSIVITGCSTGIGWCAATTLTARGYRVFATARKSEDVEKLQQQGLESLQLDINDSASIRKVVTEILARTGGTLDALCNNAGFGQPGAVEDASREALRNQFETNVFGLQELTNQIIPVMRAQGHGRIINISSVLGFAAMPYRGIYSASKFAVEALSDALRLELRPTNIFVSLIEPGPIASEFRTNALNAFQQAINVQQSHHQNNYQKKMENTQMVKDQQAFTLTPDAVVAKIIKALEDRKPKAHYYVGLPTYLLSTLKRILPTSVFDWVITRIAQQEMK